MAKTRTPRTPSFRLHKPTRQGFAEINGRRHYLGRYDSPEAKRKYHRLIAEWIAGGYRLPVAPQDITLPEVCDAYIAYAKTYYRTPDGRPTSTMAEIRLCADTLLERYGAMPAVEFGPMALRAIRQQWIDRDMSISTINSYCGTIKRMFKWAVSRELVPEETYRALATLEGLRRGRGVGKDPQPRQIVPPEHIDAVLPYLPSCLRAVARLQLYTAARPSELLRLRRGDIDITENGPWVAVCRDHKNAYRGKERRLFFGPRAQAVLRPFLLRMDSEYLFSPREAVQERHERDRKGPGRRPNQKPNKRATDRVVGEFYDFRAYGHAMRVACKKAGVPPFCPYRLRHTAATTIEATADMETARAILGHAGLDITQVYIHRDNQASAAYAALHG